MKQSTKRMIIFFMVSVGGLLIVLHDLYQEKNRWENLEKIREEKKKSHQDFLVHQTMHHKITLMEQQGFFEVFDQEKVIETLNRIARIHRISLHNIQIQEPLCNEDITRWPIHLRMTSRCEEALYAMIQAFINDLPGLVILEEVKIIQRKKYDFEMDVGFSVVRGGRSLACINSDRNETAQILNLTAG